MTMKKTDDERTETAVMESKVPIKSRRVQMMTTVAVVDKDDISAVGCDKQMPLAINRGLIKVPVRVEQVIESAATRGVVL